MVNNSFDCGIDLVQISNDYLCAVISVSIASQESFRCIEIFQWHRKLKLIPVVLRNKYDICEYECGT